MSSIDNPLYAIEYPRNSPAATPTDIIYYNSPCGMMRITNPRLNYAGLQIRHNKP